MAECRSCSDPADKKCPGCSQAWYCTESCMRDDLVRHIFDCNPHRGINTADHLALAVHESLIPDDPQTRLDYGFTAAFTATSQSYLLGLYIGLISHLEIKPQMLHKWRLQGILVQKIKAAYEGLPVESRGGYYPWFLENQHVLSTSTPDPSDKAWEMQKNAWVFIGESAADDEAAVKAKIATWSGKRQTCCEFYTFLLAGLHPGPHADMWVNLGFCACNDLDEEAILSNLYKGLIHKCTFNEFVTAYESSALLGFLQSEKPQDEPISGLGDVLSGSPIIFKSVWWLKQFVMAREDNNVELRLSVRVDYGFGNCKNEDDLKTLKHIYKNAFEMRTLDPIQLHEAAIQGRLFEFMSGKVDLTGKKKKFTRLLKNPYPLPDL